MSSLKIDDQTLSLTEIFGQLQLFGKLQPFLQELASQSTLIQEISRRDDLAVDSSELMQAIMDFRLKKELTDQDKFQAWLTKEHLDNTTFQQRVMFGLKLKKLQQRIAEPDLQTYFEAHKGEFDQLKLELVAVSDEAVAHRLKERVTTNNNLQQLVNEYATTNENDVVVRVVEQEVQRRSLPTELKAQFTTASPGAVVGPAHLNGNWCCFRVNEIIPGELDSQVTQQLESQLFSKWLLEKLSTVQISFDTDPNTVAEG